MQLQLYKDNDHKTAYKFTQQGKEPERQELTCDFLCTMRMFSCLSSTLPTIVPNPFSLSSSRDLPFLSS